MRTRWIAVVLIVLSAVTAPVAAETATIEEHGYLTVRDGTRLRYHVIYPAEPAGGRFPVLLNHEGYGAGTNAREDLQTLGDEVLRRGYALLGVSVRGTGCSEGVFDPFETLQARDAYDIIEWAGTQPSWSNGRVGMIGSSFGGITQLLAAPEQPPHLYAIAPSAPLADIYRDVAFPGGIENTLFTAAWTYTQKNSGTISLGTRAAPEGDVGCFDNYASHEIANTDHVVVKRVRDTPYADDPHPNGETWFARSPVAGFGHITVPTLIFGAWQDDALGAHVVEYLSSFGNPAQLWVKIMNGHHAADTFSPRAIDVTLSFLDRFVRGVDGGFDEEPGLELWMDTLINVDGEDNVPSWRIDLPIAYQPTPRAFYLTGDGRLGDEPPWAADPDTYRYPLPSADLTGYEAVPRSLGSDAATGQVTWKVPVPPGGALAYTTGPLAEDLVVAGPASLDVWLASTATDTDLQVTITELRPDGMETFVQRGWLRASHRRLDPDMSTALRPYHTHARGDAATLTPNVPEAMRIEVIPFAHAFRAGSQLRVWLDAPTGRTYMRGFSFNPEPAVNTVLHDAAHPSRLMVGVLPGETAKTPLPACDTLMSQPCRLDPLTVFVGSP